MALRPAARKAALLLHVVASVGWLGAVAVFLALAVAAARGDGPAVPAGYLAMDVAARCVIVPLAVGALLRTPNEMMLGVSSGREGRSV